ncbi:MAG: hypothetical protein WCK47_15060, partial [bacterium]
MAAAWLLCAAGNASAQYDPQTNPYYVKIPNVTGFWSTTGANTFSSAVDSSGAQIYWQYCPEAMTCLSISGLAAKAAMNGTNSELVWCNLLNYPNSYGYAKTDLFSRKHLQALGTKSPWQLVDIFKAKGVIKGYVVYHYETGTRAPWSGGPFDASINAATVYAHRLDAILIEQGQIAAANARGLVQLADCRGMTQENAWNTWKNQINKSAIVVVDPKLPWNRDYAVATGCFAMFALDPASPNQVSSFYRNTVLPALSAHFPVFGWAGGDEFNQTQAVTVRSGFNTATSFDCNLFVHSQITPGVDDPLANYQLNSKSAADLTSLTWAKKDVHYMAMIMSDGDFFGLSNSYVDDAATHYGEYYGNPKRGLFPFTWGVAAADLFQTMPTTLRVLGETATPNDQFIQYGGGYYYPDLYPDFVGHMRQIKPLAEKMKLRTWMGIFTDIDSTAARAAQNTVAATLTDLAGVFPIQYSPYTGGGGQITWARNSADYEIPVITAKYAVWNNSPFANEGTGPEAAQFVNNAAHSGPLNSAAFFDWTIIHVWSFFKHCADMNQTGAIYNHSIGVERAYASAVCLYNNLAPHVRVVTAEELAWQAALHLRTQDALNRIYDAAQSELSSGSQTAIEVAVLARHIADGRMSIATTESASLCNIDLGSSQYAPYGTPTLPELRVTVNSTEQLLNGSLTTKFQTGTRFAFTNMTFPAPVNISAIGGTLDFGLYGDGSGAVIRLELWSTAYAAFLYTDITLSFNGWRHYSLQLDGSNGLLAHGAAHAQIRLSVDIWQVSGPWNGRSAQFYLGNARVMTPTAPIAVNDDFKYEQFMKSQDRLKAVRSGNALRQIDESFETFTTGPLPQNGWIDSAGAPSITVARAFSGSKSLKLGGGDA